MNSQKGFTLVEILIVVIILGILAAIVIPQFTEASNDARRSSVTSDLQTLRSQIELYKVQHLDTYPTLANFVAQMTGTTDETGDTSGSDFGPYLQQMPVNPYTNSSTVVAPGEGTVNDGWEYNENTGAISAVGFDETTGEYTAPE